MSGRIVKKKKLILMVTACALVAFGIYNVIWYHIVHDKYDTYIKGMELNHLGEIRDIIEPSYYFGDGVCQYSVKYPAYLRYTGNLAISNKEDTYSMIIWPSFFDNTEYGVMLSDGDDAYSIMVNKKMKAIDENAAPIVEKNKKNVQWLLEKANERWDL